MAGSSLAHLLDGESTDHTRNTRDNQQMIPADTPVATITTLNGCTACYSVNKKMVSANDEIAIVMDKQERTLAAVICITKHGYHTWIVKSGSSSGRLTGLLRL